jgi:hypothetical protein
MAENGQPRRENVVNTFLYRSTTYFFRSTQLIWVGELYERQS